MNRTSAYNEINYIIDEKPYLPIAILCEEEITLDEIEFAKKIGVPILYRKEKSNDNRMDKVGKGYTYKRDKWQY